MKKLLFFMMAAVLMVLSGACKPEIKPAPDNNKKTPDCVMMGNSITELWNKGREWFFVENNIVSAGIGGHTSSDMRERFVSDVISKNGKVVSIMAGINDIAQNDGYISNADILNNIASMAEMAQRGGSKVILCSVLPANTIGWNPAIRPADLVIDLNSRIKAYAESHDCVYLDYWTRLVDENTKGLPAALTTDGVHVTDECYEIMEEMFLSTLKPLLQ
jgi:lysophospholipase L1-like esterase